MGLTVFSRGQGKDPDSSKVVPLGADPLNGSLFTQEVPTYHYFDPTFVKNTEGILITVPGNDSQAFEVWFHAVAGAAGDSITIGPNISGDGSLSDDEKWLNLVIIPLKTLTGWDGGHLVEGGTVIRGASLTADDRVTIHWKVKRVGNFAS